uniref:Uncharacterized protein n=1 Tax=Ananas comosus var. bracteatus TaxID=296719 RepID=A0A6V7PEJ8_ANACO|nr:unnamed protein product [Ananas comosus var. bracteatus]
MVERRRRPLILASTRAILDSFLNSAKSNGAAEDDGVLRPRRFRFADEDGGSASASLRLKAGILRVVHEGGGANEEFNELSSFVGVSADVLRGLAITSGSASVNDELIRDVIAQTSGFMPRDILALVADAGHHLYKEFFSEADLLLSHGHEADLKALPSYSKKLPNVDKLKKLLLHEPVILTLSEEGQSNSDLIPRNIEQYWISCSAHDKLLYIYALLKPKPRLLAGKV